MLCHIVVFMCINTITNGVQKTISTSDEYISGALELRVFPSYEISTMQPGKKPVLYNDNQWHTVTVAITKDNIQMHTDDHDLFE